MLPNVKQKTIKPIITTVVVKGTMIYTDEYSIYARLPVWGYQHKTVCHSRGEYARDEDGDGFHEVHVNTMEGFAAALLATASSRYLARKAPHLSEGFKTRVAAYIERTQFRREAPWTRSARTARVSI